MAKKTLPSSSGYFNDKMIAILEGKKEAKDKKPAKPNSGKKK